MNTNSKKEIPIFFALNDAYIPFLAVTIKSLIDNSSENYLYNLRILYTSISKENIERIKKFAKDNVIIEFVDLNYYIDRIKDKLYTRDYYSKDTYFRLFLPTLYPEYDKILYLDCDIVILDDIAKLYNTNINNYLLGAVTEETAIYTQEVKNYAKRVIGVSDNKHYFNAGILLMNLKELREFGLQEKFLYLLEKNIYSVAQDQDYLNRMCKGRVKYLSQMWNKSPAPLKNVNPNKIKIIHYTLARKPWHNDSVLYSEYFWNYAKQTDFYEEILEIKRNYTPEQLKEDEEKTKKLFELAEFETECVGYDRTPRSYSKIKNTLLSLRKRNVLVKQSEDRLAILEEISKLEKEGKFDVDAENDPPTIPIMPGEVDYLNEKLTSKLKTTVANTIGLGFIKELLRKNQLMIKEINGLENINDLTGGAILTCNHFNPFDVFAVETAFRSSNKKRKTLYKVIREGNYTNFPGFYGYLFRNSNTLPLATSPKAMEEFIRAVEKILADDEYILIYPEQSLWWNYKKPKPLKSGAFRFASKNNVPVVPIFITMKNSDKIGDDGFPILEYYINIDKPIYPDESLSVKENTENMKAKNFEVWKNIYENFYNIPLEYTTQKEEDSEKSKKE